MSSKNDQSFSSSELSGVAQANGDNGKRKQTHSNTHGKRRLTNLFGKVWSTMQVEAPA